MPLYIKSHKIKLNPTTEQQDYFWKCAKVARNAFNWGMAEYNKRLDAKEKVTGYLLKKEYNAIKTDEFPMALEVTSWAYQGAFDDLQSAFSNFFDRQKKDLLKPPKGWKPRKDGRPFGWPRFKSARKSKPAFYLANTAFRTEGHQVKMPHIGRVNMCEKLRFQGEIKTGRVSYWANHWWLSVAVQMEHEPLNHNDDAVGIDVGIKYLATTSDGKKRENRKPFLTAQRKLRRLQRSISRMEEDQKKRGDKTSSNNLKKAYRKLRTLHATVTNKRREHQHEFTSQITQRYGIIAVEDLNIRGMMQNRRLSKDIGDAGLFEMKRQLKYKADWQGGRVVEVDRWYPSSKTCNRCGWINATLKLSDRQWTCGDCGTVNERDKNAALNVLSEGLRMLNEK